MAAASLDAGSAQAGGALLGREAGEASGDWFRSRSYQAYQLRRFVAGTGKVEVTALAADGAPTVTSTLKTPLQEFAWIDDQDRVWTAPALEPGKAVVLAAAKDAPWPRMSTMMRCQVGSSEETTGGATCMILLITLACDLPSKAFRPVSIS